MGIYITTRISDGSGIRDRSASFTLNNGFSVSGLIVGSQKIYGTPLDLIKSVDFFLQIWALGLLLSS